MHLENATAGTLLDLVVVRAHTISVYGRKVHAYFIASNLAAVIALIVSLAVLGRFPGIAAWQFTLVFVGMLACYRVAREVKGRWLGMPSRSFLQDSSSPAANALPFFLLGYSALRFVLDFWRPSSARPRIGVWSEAQVVCVGAGVLSAAWLMTH